MALIARAVLAENAPARGDPRRLDGQKRQWRPVGATDGAVRMADFGTPPFRRCGGATPDDKSYDDPVSKSLGTLRPRWLKVGDDVGWAFSADHADRLRSWQELGSPCRVVPGRRSSECMSMPLVSHAGYCW